MLASMRRYCSGLLRRLEALRARRKRRYPRHPPEGTPAMARRLVHFWIVWSVLLLIHEGGHALVARHQGLDTERVTVGVGPALWRGTTAETELVLRLLPLAGLTEVRDTEPARDRASDWAEWSRHAGILSGGVFATLALVLLLAGVVALSERASGSRCVWGRIVIADAMVLSVFNLLPVPPLDGGRAMLSALSAWRDTPLSADALFWLQVGGFAVAVVPMALWTRWTGRIDAIAMRWRAPTQDSRRP